jgi:alkylhydroperoxidase family enzyme
MQPRITSPAVSLPGVLDALQALGAAASQAGLPQTTTDLVHLRVSQINGCAGPATMPLARLDALPETPKPSPRAAEKKSAAASRRRESRGWGRVTLAA